MPIISKKTAVQIIDAKLHRLSAETIKQIKHKVFQIYVTGSMRVIMRPSMCVIQMIRTVSYPHLDVYKRQTLYNGQ